MKIVHRMTDEELELEADMWDEATHDMSDAEESRAGRVRQEIEARELWNHDDAHVRESIGNYS